MICPKCQTPNRASAKFCDECGYELPSVAPVAHDMFDEEEQTCTPKSAPTADLNGIDKTNDSSFSENPIKIEEEPIEENENEEVENNDGLETVAFNPVDVSVFNTEDEADNASSLTSEITQVIDVNTELDSNDISAQKTNIMEKTVADTGVIDTVSTDDDEVLYASKNYTNQANKTKKNFDPVIKRNLIIAVSTIVIIAAILGITYFAQLWGGKIVPDVVGLTKDEAISKLESNNFKADIEEIMSDEVEGSVLSTDPNAGARINEGASIKVRVAIRRTMPDLIGQTEADAKALLEKNGFTNMEFVKAKSDEAKGSVISTNPEAGTRTTANTKLTITVAEPFTVPDVVGLDRATAESKLSEAGFKVKVTTKFDETVAEGTVLSSTPEASAEAKSGTEVEIVVSEKKSTRMLNWTRDFFNSMTRLTIDGVDYEMVGLRGVDYTSEDVVYFNFQARRYQTVTWFGSTPETRYGETETITGTIKWNENGDIVAISPNIKKA